MAKTLKFTPLGEIVAPSGKLDPRSIGLEDMATSLGTSQPAQLSAISFGKHLPWAEIHAPSLWNGV
ncbi:hypothetical protein [Enterovirga sp. CN4-39]|uniref:hypothetical protein n=1 Tax=Enterovirga sp. CN4-39 TaxID=3400910 RepID=UPI003C050D28